MPTQEKLQQAAKRLTEMEERGEITIPRRKKEIEPSPTLGGAETPEVVTAEETAPEPEFQLTEPEREAQTEIERLRELNKQLIGEAEFREEKREEAGIPEFTATQRDLQNKLKALQREALAIPIKLELEPETAGRARAVSAIERRRKEKLLRENTIKALQTATLLEAAQGNLATAREQVDRAVAEEYDPIREEIKVKQANLDLILESPETTMAEKKRAEQQKRKQNKRERETKEDAAQEESILNFANSLIEGGFDNAEVLSRIQNATDEDGRPSLAEAQRIAAETGATRVFEKEEKDLLPTQTERQQEKEKKAADVIFRRLPDIEQGVTPEAYKRLRSLWAKSIGDTDRFDEIFSVYLKESLEDVKPEEELSETEKLKNKNPWKEG